MKSFAKRFIPVSYRPAARRVYEAVRSLVHHIAPSDEYEERKRRELHFFAQRDKVHELPAIAHYWSNKYLVPMLQPFGFSNALECFRPYLQELCLRHSPDQCLFLSIGAGSSDAEINMARWLADAGIRNFSIECVDINNDSVDKARRTAMENRVEDHIRFSIVDVNQWQPSSRYHAVLALQSLHHVVNLERLFDAISHSLHDDGCFLTDDMIGRNGHQRWPEAMAIVEEIWKDLPPKYKYNQQLRRFEERFDNWDCSAEGFEGIRSQDILPLLIEGFHFELFFAFGNVIDIFIDRSFGHNFNPDDERDRNFIDRVHAIDTAHLEDGRIKPTHMLAVMRKNPVERAAIYKHFSPEYCVRTVTKA